MFIFDRSSFDFCHAINRLNLSAFDTVSIGFCHSFLRQKQFSFWHWCDRLLVSTAVVNFWDKCGYGFCHPRSRQTSSSKLTQNFTILKSPNPARIRGLLVDTSWIGLCQTRNRQSEFETSRQSACAMNIFVKAIFFLTRPYSVSTTDSIVKKIIIVDTPIVGFCQGSIRLLLFETPIASVFTTASVVSLFDTSSSTTFVNIRNVLSVRTMA